MCAVMSKMSRNLDSRVMLVIQTVRNMPTLYNTQLEDYYDKEKVNRLWGHVAEISNLSNGRVAKNCWRRLERSFYVFYRNELIRMLRPLRHSHCIGWLPLPIPQMQSIFTNCEYYKELNFIIPSRAHNTDLDLEHLAFIAKRVLIKYDRKQEGRVEGNRTDANGDGDAVWTFGDSYVLARVATFMTTVPVSCGAIRSHFAASRCNRSIRSIIAIYDKTCHRMPSAFRADSKPGELSTGLSLGTMKKLRTAIKNTKGSIVSMREKEAIIMANLYSEADFKPPEIKSFLSRVTGFNKKPIAKLATLKKFRVNSLRDETSDDQQGPIHGAGDGHGDGDGKSSINRQANRDQSDNDTSPIAIMPVTKKHPAKVRAPKHFARKWYHARAAAGKARTARSSMTPPPVMSDDPGQYSSRLSNVSDTDTDTEWPSSKKSSTTIFSFEEISELDPVAQHLPLGPILTETSTSDAVPPSDEELVADAQDESPALKIALNDAIESLKKVLILLEANNADAEDSPKADTPRNVEADDSKPIDISQLCEDCMAAHMEAGDSAKAKTRLTILANISTDELRKTLEKSLTAIIAKQKSNRDAQSKMKQCRVCRVTLNVMSDTESDSDDQTPRSSPAPMANPEENTYKDATIKLVKLIVKKFEGKYAMRNPEELINEMSKDVTLSKFFAFLCTGINRLPEHLQHRVRYNCLKSLYEAHQVDDGESGYVFDYGGGDNGNDDNDDDDYADDDDNDDHVGDDDVDGDNGHSFEDKN